LLISTDNICGRLFVCVKVHLNAAKPSCSVPVSASANVADQKLAELDSPASVDEQQHLIDG